MKAQVSSKDWELLSAFLDDELPVKEREKLEKRLQTNQELKDALADLTFTKSLLRQLPRKKVPHHFRVTSVMLQKRSTWAKPLSVGFSLASLTSLAMIILTFVFQFGARAAASAMQAAQQAVMLESAEMSDQEAEPAPLIIWGTPGAPSALAGGYGGGGDMTSSQSGGGVYPAEPAIGQTMNYPAEAAPMEQPAPYGALPSSEEGAAPLLEKEVVSTPEEIPMLAAPTQQAVQEGQNLMVQPTSEALLSERENVENGPILGVIPSEERRQPLTPTAAADVSLLQADHVRRFFDPQQSIFWIRLGLVLIAAGSAVAAVSFFRKTRI